MECVYCGSRERELRPYGPNGEGACFDCAMMPEHLPTTRARFASAMKAAEGAATINGGVPLVTFTSDGPVALDGKIGIRRCPCGAVFGVTLDAKGEPNGVLHGDPACDAFRKLEPAAFVRYVRGVS